jgi:hypothetical protein
MTNVVVSGAIANKYLNGGEAWIRLSWLLGLRRLGCDVHFVEQIAPENCVDAEGKVVDFEASVNLSYLRAVMDEHGLSGSATLILENGEKTSGLALEELLAIARGSELLVNMSGHLTLEPLLSAFERKVYVDTDPGFTQLWHHQRAGGFQLTGHDDYFTCGENIGRDGCSIPTDGIRWRPLPHLVVLEEWPVVAASEPARFTTIGSLRGAFGPIEHQGETLGLKVHELRRFIEVPERMKQMKFEIALDAHPADTKEVDALRKHGWRVVDPKATVPGPSRFRSYVQESGAEFSVAQGVYVATESGWFSDRSVRYLASGKPVVVQDTGFSRNYPVGEGLLAFRSVEEAVAGAEQVARSYESHCRAARDIAEQFFDSDKVLARFLEDVGVGVEA